MLVCRTKGFPVKLSILSQADCLGNRSEPRTRLKQFLCCRRRKEEATFGGNNKLEEKSFKKALCTPQLIRRQGQDWSPGPSISVSDFTPLHHSVIPGHRPPADGWWNRTASSSDFSLLLKECFFSVEVKPQETGICYKLPCPAVKSEVVSSRSLGTCLL
ncbi:hypothetical protein HJG60_009470 [Phyllostomus discolor]|uniref:Uncharacterized protein n=1 Tax=Phyllostomus discolor TaxID=89673 RepID=A0A833YC06_9CHIR|nr:hypothetical protein HJG60_009470 [Phyllostomus discolor]